MKPARHKPTAKDFDITRFLGKIADVKSTIKYPDKKAIFKQGEVCEGLFYLVEGKVKLTVISKQGKEAILTVVNPGDYFGEGCLNHQLVRMTTATATGPVVAIRLERETMRRLLHQNQQFAESFTNHLLGRTRRVEEDLVDHLFNSSERRLARMLLMLANVGKDAKTESIYPTISQDTLAAMIDTTRQRINFFMNKFRRLGFLEYDEKKMSVHSSLLSVVLAD